MYFSFDVPTYAVSDAEISKFRNDLVSDKKKACDHLAEIARLDAANSNKALEVLFDRLIELPNGALSGAELKGLSFVLCDMVELLAVITSEVPHGFGSLWPRAIKLLYRTEPQDFLVNLKQGNALPWLAYVIRSQGFAYGRPEPDRARDSRKWLTEGQLDRAISQILSRFKNLITPVLAKTSSPMDIFYLWLQLGPKNQIKYKIARETKTDEDFICLLKAMQGVSYSSSGTSKPLRKSTVERFLEPAKALMRLKKIARSNSAARDNAANLLENWNESEFGSD